MVNVIFNGYETIFNDAGLRVEQRNIMYDEYTGFGLEDMQFETLSRGLRVSEINELNDETQERLNNISKVMYQELNYTEWPPCQEGFETIFAFLLRYFEYDNAYKELIFMLSKTLESLYYGYCRVITETFWGSDREFYEKYRGNMG